MKHQIIKRDKFKKALKFKGLTQKYIADHLMIEYHYLQRMLSEEKIQDYRLDEIAKTLDITPMYLTGEQKTIISPLDDSIIEIDDILENKKKYRSLNIPNGFNSIDKYMEYSYKCDLIFEMITYRYYKRDHLNLINTINDLTLKYMGYHINEKHPTYTKEEYKKIADEIGKIISNNLCDCVIRRKHKLPFITRSNPSLPETSPYYDDP